MPLGHSFRSSTPERRLILLWRARSGRCRHKLERLSGADDPDNGSHETSDRPVLASFVRVQSVDLLGGSHSIHSPARPSHAEAPRASDARSNRQDRTSRRLILAREPAEFDRITPSNTWSDTAASLDREVLLRAWATGQDITSGAGDP